MWLRITYIPNENIKLLLLEDETDDNNEIIDIEKYIKIFKNEFNIPDTFLIHYDIISYIKYKIHNFITVKKIPKIIEHLIIDEYKRIGNFNFIIELLKENYPFNIFLQQLITIGKNNYNINFIN